MKTNHKNIRVISLIATLLAFNFQSCKKFIEIPPPNTQLLSSSVFGNNTTATSAQTSIYSEMWANSESPKMAQYMGLYADELQNYSSQTQQTQCYMNSLQPSTNPDSWYNYYVYIYHANSVVSGLQNASGVSSAVKNQLLGEALFIRAFCHFYLSCIYGDVPLVLTTDPNTNQSLARTPRLQVMQQVAADLQNARGLLNTNYVDAATDTAVTLERVRPNKAVASALLARVFLYLGDYTNNGNYYIKADSAASTVIANSKYSLSNLSGVFLKNSSEAIWQWQTPQPASFDTQDGQYFLLVGAPSSGNTNSTTLSAQLLNAFETGDQRFTNWVGSITEGTTIYYFPYKYKIYNTYKNQEYTMVLRLAEQYLIRAEARVRENNILGALSDLNAIRTRAGLPNYSGSQDATSVLASILHERQVEFFGEWGHRWFDLQRAFANNLPVNAVTVMGGQSGVCHYKGGSWNSNNYQLLFPIPQYDISTDHNLTQNKGY